MVEDSIKVVDLNYNLKSVVNSAIVGLGKNFSVLIVTKAKNYQNICRAFTDIFINDNSLDGIYLTTNRPFEKVLVSLKTGLAFDEKKLFFIDCMSEDVGDADNAVVATAKDLSELDFAVKHAIQDNPKAGFFIVDSLSTLFIDNEAKSVEKFTRDLIEKVDARKMKAIVLATKTEDNEAAIETISVFFDKIIQIGEDD